MDDLFFDRACGCLFGLAIGDAMGAPIEGMTAGDIRQRYGQVDGFFEMQVRPSAEVPSPQSWYRLKATYTDDTQMALAVMDSLVESRGFDPDHMAGRFVRLIGDRDRGQAWVFRGSGRNTRTALEQLRGGTNWRHSGMASPSDGAAMRVAPVGLFYWDDKEALVQASIQQAMITHRDARAMASAAAIACGVAALVSDRGKGDLDIDAFMRGLVEDVRHAERHIAVELSVGTTSSPDHTMSTILEEIHERIHLLEENLLAHIAARANSLTERTITHGTESFCLAAVPSSICFFVQNASSFERVITRAINAGKDTDTVGAMAGALAGAHLGYKAVPLEWVLEIRNGDQLYHRVRDWLGRGSYGDKVFDLHEMEHRLQVEEVWKARQIKHHPQPLQESVARPSLGELKLDGRWVMETLGLTNGSSVVGQCLDELGKAMERGDISNVDDAVALVKKTAGATE